MFVKVSSTNLSCLTATTRCQFDSIDFLSKKNVIDIFILFLVCEANNSLGLLRRTISLKEGKKPPPPSDITLRGMNSNTFDLDVGAKKNGPDDPMGLIGYRFEILQKEKNQSSGGKWMNARVVLKDFTDGE